MKARIIAFYLPQFHPIPENDLWWGKGFTEWTNVAKAKKLFPGHYQPRIPADLGFYDLRLPEAREAQAELAREHGIAGFCYWHYWFGGRQILQRPFEEVLASGRPTLPFCLAWANESWSGVWHGAPGRILLQQTYPGPEDDDSHFRSVLPAFLDDRYLKVDGCPIFVIYRPRQMPHLERFTDRWRELALRAGLKGMLFAGISADGRSEGPACLDGFLPYLPQTERLDLWGFVPPAARITVRDWIVKTRGRFSRSHDSPDVPSAPPSFWPQTFSYEEFVDSAFSDLRFDDRTIPVVVPNWDNTPRCGLKGTVLHNATPALFERHLRQAVHLVSSRAADRQLVFIRSWNEWAEGNHMEPDLRFGRGLLSALKAVTEE